MKKIWTIVIAVLAALFLLSGCGEVTLEEKMEQVQKANTIKVQDIIDLMELEGLEVNKVATDDTFNKNWPNAVLVKVNDTHYVALKSFEENLWDLKSLRHKIGWQGGIGGSYDEHTAVWYISQYYNLYPAGIYVYSSEYTAKNIVALVLSLYPDNMAELSIEEQYAVMDELNEVRKGLQRVFYKDINAMIQEDILIETENFTIRGTLSYYATGIVDKLAEREWTYYDARTWLNCDIVCSDAFIEQYEGMEYKVEVGRPDNWRNTHGSMSSGGILEAEHRSIDLPSCNTEDVLWSEPEGKPIYTLTITIGDDFTEIIQLEPNVIIEE